MSKRSLATFALLAYCFVLIKVLVLKDIPTVRVGHLIFRFGGTESGPANFVPLRTILPFLLGDEGWLIGGLNLIGNVALLVPVGFLLPLIVRGMAWKASLVAAITFGLAIETMQTIFHIGIFDIDDVLLNALGVMVGYWALLMLSRARRGDTDARHEPQASSMPRA
jgi:glycopeptide antibiotics resistance protein